MRAAPVQDWAEDWAKEREWWAEEGHTRVLYAAVILNRTGQDPTEFDGRQDDAAACDGHCALGRCSNSAPLRYWRADSAGQVCILETVPLLCSNPCTETLAAHRSTYWHHDHALISVSKTVDALELRVKHPCHGVLLLVHS